MIAKIERGSGDHKVISRSGNKKKIIGFVLLMACWAPILAIDVIGSIPSIALMLTTMGVGLWAVSSGNIRSLKYIFQRTFDGLDIDKAKVSVEAWLRAQRATGILVNDESIRAVHGSRKVVSVWKPGAMKNVLTSFERAGAGTIIKIDLQAASALYGDDVYSYSRETESSWGGGLEGLWKEMEGVSASRHAPSAQVNTGIGPSPLPPRKQGRPWAYLKLSPVSRSNISMYSSLTFSISSSGSAGMGGSGRLFFLASMSLS